jgi:hypothetical protein
VLPCLPAQPAPLAPVVLLSIFTINQTVRWGVVKIEAMQHPHDVSVAVAAPDIQERPAFRGIPKTPNKAWLEQPATSGTVTFRVVRHLISSVEFSRQRVPALQRSAKNKENPAHQSALAAGRARHRVCLPRRPPISFRMSRISPTLPRHDGFPHGCRFLVRHTPKPNKGAGQGAAHQQKGPLFFR